MIQNILIACDKFKGSLSSEAVNSTLKEALLNQQANLNIRTLKVADGGEGLIASLKQKLPLQIFEVPCRDPLGRERMASMAQDPKTGAIYIESSEATGIHLISPSERDPFKTSSSGVGDLLKAASKKMPPKIYLGLGSSSTVDGGIGCLGALGYRFLDQQGQELNPIASNLSRVSRIVKSTLKLPEIDLITDVINPPLGHRGGVRVYAPQKGANKDQVTSLEKGMQQWIHSLSKDWHQSSESELKDFAGGGAAGGLGLGLCIYFRAQVVRGAHWLLEHLEIPQSLKELDLVITGEGGFDESSLEGKITGEILKQTLTHKRPLLLVCGINNSLKKPHGIDEIYSLNDFNPTPDKSPQFNPHLSQDILKCIANTIYKQFLIP